MQQQQRYINHPNAMHVVAARPLAAILRREVERLDAELERTGEGLNNRSRHKYGATGIIAARAALFHGRNSEEAMLRRLNDILEGRCASTQAHMAESYLFAVDLNIETDCPELLTLPAGMEAAREQIRVNLEIREAPEWFILQHEEELAKDLLEFACTVILDGTEALDGPERTQEIQERNRRANVVRRANRKAQTAQLALEAA